MNVPRSLWRLISPGAGVALLIAGVILLWPHATSAQYVQNNLIDDNIFLNANSMSQSQIQTFLTNRGGYLARYQLLFDCASTGTASNNAYVAAGAPCGQTVYASTIIYYAAQVYGLNPQAIMATLQKEQSLITATNPTSSQLNFAMGYGCADSTGCANNSGFLHQVDDATWQFRINFERSWGNNSWWDSQFHYVCPAATKYYSTGLYPGRNVTFYDDYGTGYTNFVINDGATASLYCYTPHAYPGSAREYYSGSYNFVVAFENWFGSTQPAVQVTSPIRVNSVPQGAFSGTPTTASFDMVNNTNAAMTVNVAVTVRDAQGNNLDYPLRSISIVAHGSATYSESKTFASEGTYTFGLTSLTGGVWNDGYPSSSSIDNARSRSVSLLAMPTITVTPASDTADMRVGKTANMSFTVKNNSQQSMSVGQVALAIRGPNGENNDLALVNPGTLAAGASYTYSKPFTPQAVGAYRAFITDTTDGGNSWNESDYPAQATGVSRSVQLAVKPNPTLTQGPALSVASPHVGQQIITSFKVKNFGSNVVNVGLVGMAIRDPQGRNVDSGSANLVVNANSEYVFQASATFQTPGTYTAWITSYHNGTWDDTSYPATEDATVIRRITFTVLPNPTITVQPTVTTADPRVGKALSATFTIHNYGSQSIDAGQLALAVRDPSGKNADFQLQNAVIAAGGDFVYTATNPGSIYKTPGTYTAWITSYHNGTWDDTSYPATDSSTISRRMMFNVASSPTVTTSVTSSNPTPSVGQSFTLSFKVKNFSDSAVDLGYLGLGGRAGSNQNVDPGVVPVSLAPGEEKIVSFDVTLNAAGKVNYFIISTKDYSSWGLGPEVESLSVSKTLSVTVGG